MRTLYNLTVKKEDETKIEDATKVVKQVVKKKVVHKLNKEKVVTYTVWLSKYEFLYVRLSATLLKITDHANHVCSVKTVAEELNIC